MGAVLRLAALYNACYALALAIWPQAIFDWLHMPATPDVMVRCMGMLVGVYAVGYWIAACDPLRWWPLVWVGIVGKTLGPLGFLVSVYNGDLPWQAGWMNLSNDLIWLPPFWVILWAAYRQLGWAAMWRSLRPG